ncbi:hypothetical protein [Pseudovibrio sp. Tun.PSC04-5.I4]|uniref:hypothetical protein n=1 Tax=Pseudovibrio sp. Tun.PSC04-5.I4 TaxID=1798213 RepID=UPI00088B8532|nr:hypothetical protein [Pseudovibrio sp. Tun.PSC04-5.I4]SDR19735.1 hypothetical protein SAMN04515695_3338 [Pseudovibrio sp. Tun.PSC04-5.I4]
MSLQEQLASRWQLDKRVPVVLVLTLLVQVVGFVWWAASINERVISLERTVISNRAMTERVTRAETRIDGIYLQLEKIDRKLDRLTEAYKQ